MRSRRLIWALNVREYLYERVGASGVALILAYNPELLMYGGGVARNGNSVVNYVQDYLARYAWGKVQVRAALLGKR